MQERGLGNEQALQAQLSEVQQRLDGLAQDLRGIDAELEELSVEREQFALLSSICGDLQRLEELGGRELFWGMRAPEEAEAQIVQARTRLDSFDKRLSEVEDRRQKLVHTIDQAQNEADFLEDDLLELRQRQEEKKLEWVIEREVESFPVQPVVMPWTRGGEDDQRFRKSLLAALLLSLLLGLIFPMINLPLPDPWVAEEIPERLTQLIKEEPPAPPPPPKQVQEKKPEELKPEEQKLAKESKPEAKPKAAPDKSPASKGLLAFREKFSTLADSKRATRLGAQARIRKSGQAASGRSTRALIATEGPGSSGGIDIGSLSRNVGNGGDGIEGVEVGKATSSIAAIAGDSDRPLSDGPGLSRTDEEIQIVFDRHKAALYRLYNRALRQDPTLKGQMVLRITIQPDGSVTLCEVQSSDMDAPKLSAQVVGRVKTFDFGAKDGIPAITILYPIDFLPAS